MSESRTVVLLCVDLMMISTISVAASRKKLMFRTVETVEQLRKCTEEDLVLIDMSTPGLCIEQAAAALNNHQKQSAVVYGPHVRTEQFEQARKAGFEHVMARGRFSAEAGEIVNDFSETGWTA